MQYRSTGSTDSKCYGTTYLCSTDRNNSSNSTAWCTYEYSVDLGAYQAGVTFAGLSVGNHTLTARLAASTTCISAASAALTVNAVPAVPAVPTASVTVQPTCAVPTGTIVVTAPLGAQYEYSVDLGAYQAGVTFAGLSVGNHTLTTRLAASTTCISAASAALNS